MEVTTLGSQLGKLWLHHEVSGKSITNVTLISPPGSTAAAEYYIHRRKFIPFFEFFFVFDIRKTGEQIAVIANHSDEDTKLHTCRKCGVPGAKHRCTGCESVYYCSGKCQREDWRQHRAYCKLMDSIICFCVRAHAKIGLTILNRIVHDKLTHLYKDNTDGFLRRMRAKVVWLSKEVYEDLIRYEQLLKDAFGER